MAKVQLTEPQGERTFVHARPSGKQPLARLPRNPGRDEDGAPLSPSVDIFVEFGRGTAGCCICLKPIAPQTSRVVYKVYLRDETINKNGTTRRSERYFSHPGCITERIRPEVIRFAVDCYDCGARPDNAGPGTEGFHPYSCFTVSKFAPGRLCRRCVRKPRWAMCRACHTFYPPWLIHQVADMPDSVPVQAGSPWAALDMNVQVAPPMAEGQDACEYCVQRYNLRTVQSINQAANDFEQLKKKIKSGGLWDGEDD